MTKMNTTTCRFMPDACVACVACVLLGISTDLGNPFFLDCYDAPQRWRREQQRVRNSCRDVWCVRTINGVAYNYARGATPSGIPSETRLLCLWAAVTNAESDLVDATGIPRAELDIS